MKMCIYEGIVEEEAGRDTITGRWLSRCGRNVDRGSGQRRRWVLKREETKIRFAHFIRKSEMSTKDLSREENSSCRD